MLWVAVLGLDFEDASRNPSGKKGSTHLCQDLRYAEMWMRSRVCVRGGGQEEERM